MRDQRLQIELALRHELKERLHVAGFGPTHVANGIVAALLLVSCVIAARTVGTRDAEVELFAVVEAALDVHADSANSDHRAAVTRYLGGEIDGTAARSLRRDQHNIGAMSGSALHA